MKRSKDSASFLVRTGINLLVLFFFVADKWGRFLAILAQVTWPWAQPLDGNISLKFSLETRLQSESFEPSIDFLAFLVKKMWVRLSILLFFGHNF